MTTTVQVEKIGENFVLPLNDEMLDKLGVKNGGKLEVTTLDDSVVLRPSRIDNQRQEEFQKLKNKIFDEYADVFTALAEGAK